MFAYHLLAINECISYYLFKSAFSSYFSSINSDTIIHKLVACELLLLVYIMNRKSYVPGTSLREALPWDFLWKNVLPNKLECFAVLWHP